MSKGRNRVRLIGGTHDGSEAEIEGLPDYIGVPCMVDQSWASPVSDLTDILRLANEPREYGQSIYHHTGKTSDGVYIYSFEDEWSDTIHSTETK